MDTHLNRETVDRRLARLRDEYGSFPVIDSQGELPPDRFDDLLEKATEGYTGGGYAWTVREPEEAPSLSESMPDDAGANRPQVLLIRERDSDELTWSIPGGGREDGETYEAATKREVAEETGVSIALEEPFLVIRDRIESTGERPERLHTLWVHFDAEYEAGHIDLQPGELRGAGWFGAAPRELANLPAFRATEWWDDYEPDDRWWEEYDVRGDDS